MVNVSYVLFQCPCPGEISPKLSQQGQKISNHLWQLTHNCAECTAEFLRGQSHAHGKAPSFILCQKQRQPKNPVHYHILYWGCKNRNNLSYSKPRPRGRNIPAKAQLENLTKTIYIDDFHLNTPEHFARECHEMAS